MSAPWQHFTEASVIDAVLLVWCLTVIAWAWRWERRRKAESAAWLERCRASFDRRPEDLLWEIFREPLANHARDIAWEKQQAERKRTGEGFLFTVVDGGQKVGV